MIKVHCASLTALFLSVIIVSLPVCNAASLSLQYDQNGNLVTGDGLFREYNCLNQLVRVRNGSSNTSQLLVSFSYDPLQERVAVKTEYNHDGSVKETTYYFSEDFIRVVNASGTFDSEYVFLGSQQVAQINPDNSRIYIHADHLGSSMTTTNEAGAVLDNTTYTPYGDVVHGGNTTRYDYTAQEYDATTQDYDYHARRYKPQWGIFTQPDTVMRPYTPQNLNRFSYVNNNPYVYIDPTGRVYWGEAAEATLGIVSSTSTVVQGVGYCAYGVGTVPQSYGTSTLIVAGGATLTGYGLINLGMSTARLQAAWYEDKNYLEHDKGGLLPTLGYALDGQRGANVGLLGDLAISVATFNPIGTTSTFNSYLQNIITVMSEVNTISSMRMKESTSVHGYYQYGHTGIEYELYGEDGHTSGGKFGLWEMSPGFAEKFKKAMDEYGYTPESGEGTS